ncbi:MAG: FHA domain-containing protein [Actinomycetota bacterium]
MSAASYVFCNRCGHRNPPVSTFCSSCGTVLDTADDRTIVIAKVDPLQDAPGIADDVIVDTGDMADGTAILVVRSGEDEGEHFVLGAGTTSIGRSAESDIVLDDITVSRHHSEIVRVDGHHVVRDRGSLNGTYLNQVRVDAAELSQGDEVQIGKFRLVFFEKAPR